MNVRQPILDNASDDVLPHLLSTAPRALQNGLICRRRPHQLQNASRPLKRLVQATSNFRREDESGDEATLRRILQGHSEEASLSENEDLAPGASPNMHAVMSKIIDHGETINNQYEVSGDIPIGSARSGNTISQGASLQLKIQSLPILDNL
ncbi:MAG: hypothetical protein Q9198_011372, partial [Flavoplaca austrocitrina]